jgi:hypothetical protein
MVDLSDVMDDLSSPEMNESVGLDDVVDFFSGYLGASLPSLEEAAALPLQRAKGAVGRNGPPTAAAEQSPSHWHTQPGNNALPQRACCCHQNCGKEENACLICQFRCIVKAWAAREGVLRDWLDAVQISKEELQQVEDILSQQDSKVEVKNKKKTIRK